MKDVYMRDSTQQGSIGRVHTPLWKIEPALQHILYIWLAILICTIGMATLFGVALDAAVAYAAYSAGFIILPGAVLYSLAARCPATSIMVAAKIFVIGQAWEMLLGLILTMLGLQSAAMYFLPVYVFGMWVTRNRITALLSPAERVAWRRVAVGVLVAVFLVFSAALSDFSAIIDHHYTWVAAFANAVSMMWPPMEPFLMDVPLHYHYLYNVHVGMAAHSTGIPVVLVASRLAIIIHAFVFVLVLCAFSQAHLKTAWLGVVVAIALLLTFGYSELMWKNFHFASAQIMYRVASTMIAFQIFVMLMDEVLANKAERMRLGLFVMLVAVGSGTRVNMLPMLACGVGLLMLFNIMARKSFKDQVLLLAILTGGIVFSMVFFLGVGSGHSDGTKLVVFNPLSIPVAEWAEKRYAPLVEFMLEKGYPDWVATLCYLVTALCGRMTFLFPGFVYVCMTWPLRRDLGILLGGVAVAGVGLLVLIETTVPQEIWTFYWYADIALALLGAAGLAALWRQRQQGKQFVTIGLLTTGLLFGVQATEFSIGFFPKLLATQFPVTQPVFHDKKNDDVTQALVPLVKAGDILVTGGDIETFDDRPFAAAVPGLQLYASRYILEVYGTRTTVDSRVKDRQWYIDSRLSKYSDRIKVRQNVGTKRTLFLLWLGTPPQDINGMIPIATWDDRSLWRIE